jgi:hypothetical protein
MLRSNQERNKGFVQDVQKILKSPNCSGTIVERCAWLISSLSLSGKIDKDLGEGQFLTLLFEWTPKFPSIRLDTLYLLMNMSAHTHIEPSLLKDIESCKAPQRLSSLLQEASNTPTMDPYLVVAILKSCKNLLLTRTFQILS